MLLLSEISLRTQLYEFFWGAVKRCTRENCNYSFAELEPTVLAGLESVTLHTIRSRRWIDSYTNGPNDKQKECFERQKKTHRRATGERMVELLSHCKHPNRNKVL